MHSTELCNARRNIVDSDARTSCVLVGFFGTDKFGLKLTTLFIVCSRQQSLDRGNFVRTLSNDTLHLILCAACCVARERKDAGDVSRPSLECLVN